MSNYLGQFVYFNEHAWYGARMLMRHLGDRVHPVNVKHVTSGKTDKALLLSFLSARAYPDVFTALRRASIPYRSERRRIDHPVVIAGGGAMFNPEPIADYVDVICVGDGEEFIPEVSRCLAEPTRARRIQALSELPGAYVPSRRTVHYEPGGVFVKDVEGEDTPIIPAVTTQWWPAPLYPGRQLEIEAARGCRGRCFFCSITWQVPYRERPERDMMRYIGDGKGEVSAWAPNLQGVDYMRDKFAYIGKSYKGDTRVDDFCRMPYPEPDEYHGPPGWRFTWGGRGDHAWPAVVAGEANLGCLAR